MDELLHVNINNYKYELCIGIVSLHSSAKVLLYCRFTVFCVLANGAFPPRGAGRFGAGREGAVLLRSVTCRVSTADSTLMVGGV